MGRNKLPENEKKHPNDKIICDTCGIAYPRSHKSAHDKSKYHLAIDRLFSKPSLSERRRRNKLRHITAGQQQLSKPNIRQRMTDTISDNPSDDDYTDDFTDDFTDDDLEEEYSGQGEQNDSNIKDYIINTYGDIPLYNSIEHQNFLEYLNNPEISYQQKQIFVDDIAFKKRIRKLINN